jgi:hypothetical protein
VDDGGDAITYDELVQTLNGWVGREVHVLLGPAGPMGGRVYVRWHGRLTATWADRSLRPVGLDGREPIAFQVGESPDSFLALHADAFRHAEWVSRKFEFLAFGMTGVEVGVECQPER